MSDRHCGSCHACCVHVKVVALNKPAGAPCRNLCNSGCAIYRDRPSECAAYSCAWLDGFGSAGMRPDKLGVLLEVGQIEWPKPLILLAGHETRPGALDLAARRIEQALPPGAAAFVIRHGDSEPPMLIGREEDCAAVAAWMEKCRQDGGVVCAMADGEEFVDLRAEAPA